MPDCLLSISPAAAVTVTVNNHGKPSFFCFDVQRQVVAALHSLAKLVLLQ